MMAAMQSSPSSGLAYAQALGHESADKRIDILRQIGAGGSISQAARAVGISYKAAWQALDTLTNLAGVPLVERAVGGAGGGGALLTDAGHALLVAHAAMAQARAEVLVRLQGAGGQGSAAARLGWRSSMRNQWPVLVQALQADGPLVRVHLQGAQAPALQLVARITHESAELLGLAPGLALLALCKATAVQALLQAPAPGSSNCWSGRVRRLAQGPAGDEVAAELDAGVQMVGFAPAGSGLTEGVRLWLQVDESALVLAVPG